MNVEVGSSWGVESSSSAIRSNKESLVPVKKQHKLVFGQISAHLADFSNGYSHISYAETREKLQNRSELKYESIQGL